MRPGLSRRATRLIDGHTFPEYIQQNLIRQSESWDPVHRPDGYISLCVAENKLMWDLLAPRLTEPRTLEPAALGYDDMIGNLGFRTVLSQFMARFLGRRFDPEHIMVLSGAGTVLEALFYAIADRGDTVLVPTPSYAGFWLDLGARDELTVLPVHTSHRDDFRLSTGALDEALRRAATPVKALLFTTPNNPLGRVYSAREIETIADWAVDRGIHVVFDEIYALSVFGDSDFVSVANRRPLGDLIHVVWAFSKDFAMSGFRCGVLISENEQVGLAIRGQAYWGSTSGDTQRVLAELVSDDAWIDRYVTEMQTRLANSYRRTTEALDAVGVSHLPAEAGFFVLADFRPALEEPTWEAEARLWRRFIDEANVNITPGIDCHNPEPGFLRVCFAAVPPEAVETGIKRIAPLLRPFDR